MSHWKQCVDKGQLQFHPSSYSHGQELCWDDLGYQRRVMQSGLVVRLVGLQATLIGIERSWLASFITDITASQYLSQTSHHICP